MKENEAHVFVTHGLFMRVLLKSILGHELEEEINNTAVFCFELKDGKLETVFLNKSAHIEWINILIWV